MAMDIAMNKTHAVVFPSKILSSRHGHIYNIVLGANTDNGAIIGRGSYVEYDQYNEATAPEAFAAVIRGKAANGNFEVEVTAINPQVETLLVYETVITQREDRDLRDERLYYNEKGQVVEALVLNIGDVFELSKEGFNNTPVVGKAVSVVNKKLTVAS